MDIRKGSALGTLLVVGIVAAAAAALVSVSYEFSRERIADAAAGESGHAARCPR
jgi:hypothetical protein